MDEMKSVFETTGGLCDISYKELSSTPSWNASKNLLLSDMLLKEATLSPGVLENLDAESFIEKKMDANMIICGLRKRMHRNKSIHS